VKQNSGSYQPSERLTDMFHSGSYRAASASLACQK
jgi:hypothetical protein